MDLRRRVSKLEERTGAGGGVVGSVHVKFDTEADPAAVSYEYNGEPAQLDELPQLAAGQIVLVWAHDADPALVDRVVAGVLARVGDEVQVFRVVYSPWPPGGRVT